MCQAASPTAPATVAGLAAPRRLSGARELRQLLRCCCRHSAPPARRWTCRTARPAPSPAKDGIAAWGGSSAEACMPKMQRFRTWWQQQADSTLTCSRSAALLPGPSLGSGPAALPAEIDTQCRPGRRLVCCWGLFALGTADCRLRRYVDVCTQLHLLSFNDAAPACSAPCALALQASCAISAEVGRRAAAAAT